jgi:acyl dehydratase
MDPTIWSVQARNLPEHASNPIHTDEGGRAAGFDAALVAGVTVYAYLTRPIVEAWGPGWLADGGALVEFLAPVQAGDPVDCVPATPTETGSVEVMALVDGESRARCTAWPGPPDVAGQDRPLDERLEPHVEPLIGGWADYGLRAGDDLDLYAEAGIVHPAVWPALANGVVTRHLVDGAWIHTRSRIRHHGVARVGAVATVQATVVDRFDTRSGTRAVLDVTISADGSLVATIEHEAIVELHPTG